MTWKHRKCWIPAQPPPGTVKNWPSVDIGVDKAFIAHELTIPFNAPKQVTYEGVAYEDVGGVVTTKGMVTIKVKKSRDVYSVNVKMVGKAGSASLSVKTSEFADIVAFGRSGEKLTATVANDVIVGTLSGGKFGSSCSFGASRMAFADRKDSAAQSKLAHMKGIYNVVLKDDGVFAGYLSLNVGASGKVAVKGKMIDGTSVSFKGMLLDYLNANGWYAVSAYKSLYRKTGGIGGLFWINAATGEVVLDKTGGWALNWSGSDKNGSWNKNLEVVGSKWKGNAAAYDRIVAVPTFEIPHGMVGDWNKEIIWKKPIKVTQHTGAVKDSLTLTFNGAMRDKTFNCSVSGLLFGGGGFAFGTVKVNSTKYPIVVEFKQK